MCDLNELCVYEGGEGGGNGGELLKKKRVMKKTKE